MDCTDSARQALHLHRVGFAYPDPGAFQSRICRLNGNTVLSVPANALLFRAEGLRVALFQDGHAQLTPITVGRDFGSSLEVLTDLKAGDKVILNPSDSLTNGEEIKEAPPVKEPAR